MSRQSSDEVRNGRVYNGFDYHLQVWVCDGIIQPVGLGKHLAGLSIYKVNTDTESARRLACHGDTHRCDREAQ